MSDNAAILGLMHELDKMSDDYHKLRFPTHERVKVKKYPPKPPGARWADDITWRAHCDEVVYKAFDEGKIPAPPTFDHVTTGEIKDTTGALISRFMYHLDGSFVFVSNEPESPDVIITSEAMRITPKLPSSEPSAVLPITLVIISWIIGVIGRLTWYPLFITWLRDILGSDGYRMLHAAMLPLCLVAIRPILRDIINGAKKEE